MRRFEQRVDILARLLDFHLGDAGRLFELTEALEACGVPWTGRREMLYLGTRLRPLVAASFHDFGVPDAVFEMCETQEIRYVHHTEYPNHPASRAVDCICAENMENDDEAPRR